MKPHRLPEIKRLYQTLSFVLFIIALLVLGLIGWTAHLLIQFPDDGIYFLRANGEISALRPGGPAVEKLHEGDVIVQVDNIPFKGFTPNYPEIGKHSGDQVTFRVFRQDRVVEAAVRLAAPSADLLLDRLAAILVALCFWFVGIWVGAYRPFGRGGVISFVWFQVSALTLTAGAASTIVLPWASTLFNVLLWVLGPLSVHFHRYFPENVKSLRQQVMQAVLYGLALAGLFPMLLFPPEKLAVQSWSSLYTSAGRLYLVANLFLVLMTLAYNYRYAGAPGTRGKIRLVMLGFGLTAISFTALTLLPDVLFQQPLIPYTYGFLQLILVPLTYAYAIFRLNFIEIDRHINRFATYLLVYSILGGFYLVLYALLSRTVLVGPEVSPLLNTILVLALATAFFPLHGRVQRVVDQIFYGGWYDYRLGVNRITRGLEQITDLRVLGETVALRLEKTLRLEEAVAFFRSQTGDFAVIEVSFANPNPEQAQRAFPVLPRSSLTYLLKIGVVERAALVRQLAQVTLSPEELELLKTEQIHLWVPIIGHGQVQGLLALGPKVGGDVFSTEDMDILRVVVQQLGPLIENIHLVTRLKEYAGELEARVEERTIQLHEAKERVEAILASVGDGVIVTDLDGQIHQVNTAFEGLTGLAAEEVLQTSLFQLFPEDEQAVQLAQLRASLQAHQNWRGELSGRRQDGSHYAVQFTLAPMRDRLGQVVNFVASLTDITRNKELDRMKDMFISDVSHELRTPITNIRLYLELLDGASPERQKRFLTVIKEQSELLTRLVEEILDLSRLTISKARRVTFGDVDLNTLVEQVITAHLPLAEANGLMLVHEAERRLPLVRGEQNQIGRMITNLVANAIRYTPKGTVYVRTMVERGGAMLIVEDSGIGIDPQDIPHLYERFYRGKNVRQSEIHGTGLGLAIVKEIVDLHDGRIDVSSAPGQGTTFRVWLPTVGA